MKYEIHHHYHDTDPAIRRQLDRIEKALTQLLGKVEDMAADFTAWEAELTSITDAETAVETLINKLIDQTKQNGADQATIDAFTARLASVKSKLVAATLANTPADPAAPQPAA